LLKKKPFTALKIIGIVMLAVGILVILASIIAFSGNDLISLFDTWEETRSAVATLSFSFGIINMVLAGCVIGTLKAMEKAR